MATSSSVSGSRLCAEALAARVGAASTGRISVNAFFTFHQHTEHAANICIVYEQNKSNLSLGHGFVTLGVSAVSSLG